MRGLLAAVTAAVLVAVVSANYRRNDRLDRLDRLGGGRGLGRGQGLGRGLDRGFGRGRGLGGGVFQDRFDSQYDRGFGNERLSVLSPADPGYGRFDRFDNTRGLGSLNPLGSQLGGLLDPLRGGLGSVGRGSGSYRRVKRSYGAAARGRLLRPSLTQFPASPSLPLKSQTGKSYTDGLLNSRYPSKGGFPGDTLVKEVPVAVPVPGPTVVKEVPVPIGIPVNPLGPQGLGPQSLGPHGLHPQGLGPQGLGLQGLGPQGLGSQGLGLQGLGAPGLGAGGLAPVGPLSPQGSVLGQGSFPSGRNPGLLNREFDRGSFPEWNSWVWPNRDTSQALLPPSSGFTNF